LKDQKMAIVEVKVPQLSESVAEATLLQWKKKPGDMVAADEILIEIETDKVVLEVPAPSAGVLAELVVADGGTVASDQLIARIDTDGKGAAAPAAAAPPLLLRLQLPHLSLQPQRPPATAWPAWQCLQLPS
jgi:2-oxoglutarate dehydrogenase E2 component (dihydrolipoamide succinyltransferase)